MLYCLWIPLNSFFRLSSEDAYLYFGVSLSISFITVSELFCLEFSDVPSLYYFNRSSSRISCLSSGDAYVFIGVSLSCSLWLFLNYLVVNFLKLVILLAILLPIKSLVVSAVFGITLLEEVICACICCRFLALSRSFWQYLPLAFAYIFRHIFS